MLIAFIAVVSVQWIWMKYSMREGEARFTSKVYDVLGKAVNLVEQTNNIRLFNDLKERYTQVEEVISTMNHAQDSVLADEDPGNNEISLFSLAFSKGKVGEGQGGNISSMLRIFMNPEDGWAPAISWKRTGIIIPLSGDAFCDIGGRKISRFVGTSANDGSGTGVCDSLFEGERSADGAGGETFGER